LSSRLIDIKQSHSCFDPVSLKALRYCYAKFSETAFGQSEHAGTGATQGQPEKSGLPRCRQSVGETGHQRLSPFLMQSISGRLPQKIVAMLFKGRAE
jgi:hypothetical protein